MRTKRRGQLTFIPWVDLHLLRPMTTQQREAEAAGGGAIAAAAAAKGTKAAETDGRGTPAAS